jgi:hypothetical protein
MWYGLTLAVGALLFILAVIFFNQRLSLLKYGERTVATVIELERSSSDGGYVYKPIFKFRTHDRREIIYRGYFSSSPATWEVGEKANVVYKADDPNKVKVLTYFGTFGLPVILFAISFPFIIIGGGYYVVQTFFKSFSA